MKLSDLETAIEGTPNISTEIVSSWKDMREIFKLIRNMRNASVHPIENQQVVLSNFNMNPNGSLNVPLIEIQHSETPIESHEIIEFVNSIQKLLLDCAETSIVLVKMASLLDKNPFHECVAEFDLSERRHELVRFYRAINMNGKLHILG